MFTPLPGSLVFDVNMNEWILIRETLTLTLTYTPHPKIHDDDQGIDVAQLKVPVHGQGGKMV